MSATTGWTRDRYAWFRIALGLYLLVHFAELAPWAAELFSRDGMLPDGAASPLLRAFPNVLALCDAPGFVLALVLAGAAMCVPLILGIDDRAAAIGVWFVWACLFGRNPLIANPSLPFVGLLLLVHAFAGPGRDPDWRLSSRMHRAIWVVMAVGYTYSGLTKLGSPSWMDGSAVAHVLENPLARPTVLREWLLALPSWTLAAVSYATLGLEIAFAPLALVRRARPWIWAGMLGLHVSLLVLIDFADLTAGMLLVHAFTFDPAALDALQRRRGGAL